MTWQARLPAKITKCGNLMIKARPCLPAYHHDPGVLHYPARSAAHQPTMQRPCYHGPCGSTRVTRPRFRRGSTDMGSRSRCRRKALTTHKSGFQPRFSSPAPFFLATEGIVPARGPIKSSLLPSKLPVTKPAVPCRSFPPTRSRLTLRLLSACEIRHVSACTRPWYSLCSGAHALQCTGRGQTAS